ncbi:MAG: PilZ domain [Solirubrobacteraceae bacterium]|nr:PilZ domain [Solirubrobacteraceae bacterium]
MVISPKHRRCPRVEIAVPCTLRRVKGSPVAARTLNLGSGGMLVTCARPLAIDEQVDFDFTSVEMALCGHARVVRQQLYDVYALCFERLPEEMQRCLQAFVLVQNDTTPAPTRRA